MSLQPELSRPASLKSLAPRFVAGAPAQIVLAALPDTVTELGPDLGGLELMPAALDIGTSMTFLLANSGDEAVAASGLRTSDTSDQAVDGDLARAEDHVTGQGIRIGILSDSFNLEDRMGADKADGDLPARVRIVKEGPAGSHDEGRAMAELIHRIAPGAVIDFYSATGSEDQFVDGIHALQTAGCKIIVDDVAYLDEPFFQDGSKLQVAVEQAVASGISYFTAASNQGTDYYQHAFSPIQVLLRGLPGIWTVDNFGTAEAHRPYVTLRIPNNTTCLIDLQWDQPFASISGGAGATSSLAMALYTAEGKLVGTAGSLVLGHDPRQLLEFANHTGTTSFRLVILTNAKGTLPSQFKFIVYGSGTITDPGAGIGSGSVAGHEMVAGANTVGAVAWSSTPRFGGGDTVEPYSSVGSGEILFDSQGHRLAHPISEQKVTFLAPDGSTTSVFAPFFGTSAAAPNAAAVAALVLQADPHLTPAQVTSVMEQSAIAADGPAGSTGAGLIQADAAVHLALQMAHHA